METGTVRIGNGEEREKSRTGMVWNGNGSGTRDVNCLERERSGTGTVWNGNDLERERSGTGTVLNGICLERERSGKGTETGMVTETGTV